MFEPEGQAGSLSQIDPATFAPESPGEEVSKYRDLNPTRVCFQAIKLLPAFVVDRAAYWSLGRSSNTDSSEARMNRRLI